MITHIVYSAVGLVVGMLALWWLRPTTSAGATFVLLFFILLANAAGAIAARLRSRRSHPPAEDA
jgi:uncharacterized SAM-binding protein YcdF (DUF218 family)